MPRFPVAPFLVPLFLAVFTVAAAGEDELAEGDWRGKHDWDHDEGGGAGAEPPAPSTVPPPPPGGVATPPCNGGDPAGGGVATEPCGPVEPGEPEEPGDSDGPASPSPTGPEFPPSTPPTMEPAVLTCNAKWVCEIQAPLPDLYQSKTLLTSTLFRTDAFAFVSSGFCRSLSTWYVDAFATTRASHDGDASITVVVRLDHPCPYCAPKIDLAGVSQLLAKAQVKTSWGSIDASTTASAYAGTTWGGDLDCGDRCSASASSGQGNGEISVGMDPFKITRTTGDDFVLVTADGGKGNGKTLDQDRTIVMIANRGGVSTFASGTDDNAQAKTQAGYKLVIHGQSACGATGDLKIDLVH